MRSGYDSENSREEDSSQDSLDDSTVHHFNYGAGCLCVPWTVAVVFGTRISGKEQLEFKYFLTEHAKNRSCAVKSDKLCPTSIGTYVTNIKKYANIEPNPNETVYEVLSRYTASSWAMMKHTLFERKRSGGSAWNDNVKPAFFQAYEYFKWKYKSMDWPCRACHRDCHDITMPTTNVHQYCTRCSCGHPSHATLKYPCCTESGCYGSMVCSQPTCRKEFGRCMFSKMFTAMEQMDRDNVKEYYINKGRFLCNNCFVNKDHVNNWYNELKIKKVGGGFEVEEEEKIKKDAIVRVETEEVIHRTENEKIVVERRPLQYTATCISASAGLREEVWDQKTYDYLVKPTDKVQYQIGDVVKVYKHHVKRLFPLGRELEEEILLAKQRIELRDVTETDGEYSELQRLIALENEPAAFIIKATKRERIETTEGISGQRINTYCIKYQIEDHSEQKHFEARAPHTSEKPFVREEVIRGLLVNREQLTWLGMRTLSCIPARYESQCMTRMVDGLRTMHIGTAWTRPEENSDLIGQNMRRYLDKLKHMKEELEQSKQALITSLTACLRGGQPQKGSVLESLVKDFIVFDDPKVKFSRQMFWSTKFAGSNLLGPLVEIRKTARGRKEALIHVLKIGCNTRLMFQRWKTWNIQMQYQLEEEGREKRKTNERRQAARKMQRAYRMYKKRQQLCLFVKQIVLELIENVMINPYAEDQDLLDLMDPDEMNFSDEEEEEDDDDDEEVDAEDFM
ncbi:MAG: hypothetical protein CMO44_11995 [Verrucomicrobiales bacterium]|nr:hypothetical protein [Verrucomicrobiales bacterium]